MPLPGLCLLIVFFLETPQKKTGDKEINSDKNNGIELIPENRRNVATIALLARESERNYVTRNNRVTGLTYDYVINILVPDREQRHKHRQKQRHTVNAGKPQKFN